MIRARSTTPRPASPEKPGDKKSVWALRRRQYLLGAHAFTAAAHAVLFPVAAHFVAWPAALGIAVVVWLATALRLHQLAFDRRRPRWVTELLDRPLYWHWGGVAMGTPAYGVALIVLGVGRFAEIGALGDVSLTGAGVWCYAFALLVSAWAIWIRPRWPRVRRYDLSVRGLSPALEGFRVVHLSDLHLGNFAPASWGRRWVDRANRLGPDAVAVTGDLVVSGTDFYPDVAEVLSDLRAKHGVFLCLGNHDQWDEPRLVRELEARDLAVLKNATREIEHREGRLVFGGIDDLYTKKGDLERVIGTRSDVPMILLAHYPDVGIESAERGVEVTLSGHTHGGQIGVPFLAKWLNVATLSGQLGADTFVFGSGQLVVSAGLGTTGPPMRLGVPPEIGLVVLHAA